MNIDGKPYCGPCVEKIQQRIDSGEAPAAAEKPPQPVARDPAPAQSAAKPSWQQQRQQTQPVKSWKERQQEQQQQQQQQQQQSQPLKPWQQKQQEQQQQSQPKSWKERQQEQKQQQQQQQQQAPAPAQEDSEICGGCGKAITEGRILKALGKPWHEDCFCCSRCHEKFSGSFLEYEGAACCQSCVTKAQDEARRLHETEQQMKNLTTSPPKPAPGGRGGVGVARGGATSPSTGRGASPTTYGTGRGGAPAPIARANTTTAAVGSSPGQKLSYKEQKELEKSRVKCTACQDQIENAIFRFQGVPYCETCANKVRSGELSLSVVPGSTPHCSHCKKPITVLSFKTVESKSYHTECLTCDVCGISVVDFFQEKAGKILCEPHYQEIMEIENPKKICCKCSSKIEGKYLEGGGRFYHPDCYVCEGCQCQLADKKAFAINNEPYCQYCYMKRGAEDPSIMGGLRGSRK